MDHGAARKLALKVGVAGSILPRMHLSENEVQIALAVPETFELDSSYITLKPKIGFCKFYAKNSSGDGCKREDCPRLHLCPYYVAGCCTFKNSCRKSHSFLTDQNTRILSAFKLDGLPEHMLLKMARDSPEFHLLPDVCTWYNASGCRNGQKCRFLHICKFHVAGICRYSRCRKNHRLTDLQCLGVLRAHGVDFSDSEEKTLLGALYQKMAGKGIVDSEKINHSAGDDRDLGPCSLVIPEVCGYYQEGKCTGTIPGKPYCVRLHATNPYHWQITSNGNWFNLPLGISESLEKDYTDPNNLRCKVETVPTNQLFPGGLPLIKVPGKWTANFERMTFACDRGGCFYDMRRLATLNWTTVDFQSPFTSRYCWYYSNDNGSTWHETHQIAEIYQAYNMEKAYQNGHPSLENARFDTMTISAMSGPRMPLRRRPCLSLDLIDRLLPRSCPTPFPETWSIMMTSDWLKRIALDLSSQEVIELKKAFPPAWTVRVVERVQNPFLWQQFAVRKKITETPTDRRLFIVIDSKFAAAICQENFHEVLDKSSKFGGITRGVRLSGTPQIAHQVGLEITADTHQDDEQDGFVMFSARVLIGNPMIAPGGSDDSPYSIVNDMRVLQHIIKLNMTDIYPEYFIRYEPPSRDR